MVMIMMKALLTTLKLENIEEKILLGLYLKAFRKKNANKNSYNFIGLIYSIQGKVHRKTEIKRRVRRV